MRFGGQSAIEFITTYGWAIVAIVVAMGTLYSLGVFAIGSGNAASGCVVAVGFSCTKPVLYSSGVLVAGVGLIGQTKVISAVGCSANNTAPTNWVTTNIILQSGQIKNITFTCPVPAGTKIGSIFKGTLWINYTLPLGGGGTVQQIGQVTIPVVDTGVPGIPSGTPYVTLTISNGQNVPTASNFQQMISFNPATYSQYEAGDLGNVRFYQAGSELYSWCESGCSKSAGNAVFWVLMPGSVPANGNAVVYMALENTITVQYDGIYAGESPSQSVSNGGTYAQYDNGATLFPSLYVNFQGKNVPSGWVEPYNPSAITINNGLTITLTASGGGAPSTVIGDPNFPLGVGGVLETYASLSSSTINGEADLIIYNSSASQVNFLGYVASLGTTAIFSLEGWINDQGSFSPQPGGGYHVWSFMEAPGVETGQYDYLTGSQLSYPAGNPDPWTFEFHSQITSGSGSASISSYWVRIRTYPPNGNMPNANFGPVTTG
ncbi:MAG: hypothetical protein KGH94_02705 [Candidatus Micrarchaeota archaeon]|nr:hypothetical protein [Candidatus Micrarchaeota archaeon]